MTKGFLIWILFISFQISWAQRLGSKNIFENDTSLEAEKRRERVFSLFSIVTFPNSACVTKSDTTMRGTCYTASECNSKGGISGGNCAAGFGVCCMFTVSTCGSRISQNCTYIQNPGYPSSLSTVSTTCSYTVAPVQSDICQLRLDFNNFLTAIAAQVCTDSFVATSPTGTLTSSICGTNTNMHMYVETGASATPTTLAFTIGAAAGTRTWKIKVSQIECWNPSKAPADCRQYFTGVSGSVKSYNFGGGQMLPSQQYTNCFRQELGYCAIDYSESSTATPDPFALGAAVIGNVGPNCVPGPASIIIPGDQGGAAVFCGSYLVNTQGQTVSGTVRQPVAPFYFSVASLAAQAAASGFNLVYNQVPCN